MPTCPLCDHVQAQGDTCEVCGRVLVEALPVTANVVTMVELEQTRWEEALPVDAPPIAELEQTAQAPVSVPDSRMADMEATSLPPTSAPVDSEALPDMDTGRATDDGVRVPIHLGAVTCRYCKSVQEQGLFCDRCGMRLDRMKAAAPTKVAPLPEVVGRCRRCSEKVVLGTRCRSCGMTAPLEGDGGLG